MINNIKVLHLEPTTVCNAACPQCARENSNLYNDKLNRSVITLDYCKELLDTKNWQGLVDSWNKNPHKICAEACGVKNEKTSFESQWNKEIQLR
jgi:hypothetical protein